MEEVGPARDGASTMERYPDQGVMKYTMDVELIVKTFLVFRNSQ